MTNAIGIDLGTTYCAVAIVQSGPRGPTATVLKNEYGESLTPSWVYFDIEDASSALLKKIGQEAQLKAQIRPKNAVFDAKRIIGQNFDSPQLQQKLPDWPFTVVSDSEQNPEIELNYAGTQPRRLAPQQISAELLAYLKKCAEEKLGGVVSKAVISIPAYFSDAQRRATEAAAQIANLEVLQLFHEPSAAALAYRYDPIAQKRAKNQTVLVYDFGGGTFDVSIVKSTPELVETLAHGGDLNLGGQDFTTKIKRSLVYRIQEQTGSDVQSEERTMFRLSAAAENAKKELSFQEQYTVELDNIIPGEDAEVLLTREDIEDLMVEDIEATLDIVSNCLAESDLAKEDIDEVLMIGGTTRIPIIQKMVQEYFGKKLNNQINPDEAVAIGAAFRAAQLAEQVAQGEMVPVISKCPSSYGVQVRGTYMSKIIQRNSDFPCEVTREYYTQGCQQTSVEIVVLEGENIFSKHNKVLGKFTLTDIDQRNEPVPVDVTFSLNINGIFVVSATEKNTANREEIMIRCHMA